MWKLRTNVSFFLKNDVCDVCKEPVPTHEWVYMNDKTGEIVRCSNVHE